ncbi:BnaA03g01940D [Brassica napus]|uniref:BnaA03g01940D protein n=1 Tax=Brassica napus TaxID=3708 RepID=A0A078FH09_BRANA|nr:BnaA03g01940D [Brassica napus]
MDIFVKWEAHISGLVDDIHLTQFADTCWSFRLTRQMNATFRLALLLGRVSECVALHLQYEKNGDFYHRCDRISGLPLPSAPRFPRFVVSEMKIHRLHEYQSNNEFETAFFSALNYSLVAAVIPCYPSLDAFRSSPHNMAVKLHRPGLISPTYSNPCLSRMSIGTFISCRRVVELDYTSNFSGNSSRRLFVTYDVLESRSYCFRYKLRRRMRPFLLASSSDDGVAVNGTPQPRASDDVEEMRAKLSGSLQDEYNCDELIQSLHDAARSFELALKKKISSSKLPWFSAAWLGVDRNAWVKTFSYQASVYCLLQAANEVSSRGNNRDNDLNVFVQRSLSRLAAPLDSMMRDKLSSSHPEANEWFWSDQVPPAVTSFVSCFEGDQRFVAATSAYAKGKSSAASNETEVSLLMLVLNCIAAVTKLGPTKLSCPPFFSLIPDTTGRLMDKFVDFVPLPQAYHSMKSLGLRREFLVHFGPRAAACRVKSDCPTDEVVFWVDLIQNQLLRAIDREKIWSRLTTSESIEVLERDLAIFGFFIALGRSTQSFLAANGFDALENPMEDLVRHFIGGSLLQYPQLSAISSYQLYVEVVCEELEWLPFYPNKKDSQAAKQAHGHKNRPEGPPNYDALPQILNVCSYWLQSFIKYSKWPENPSNVKAAKFLSTGHKKLIQCKEELGISSLAVTEAGFVDMNALSTEESSSFDKALESVDEALVRLESLLQQLHASSSSSGKEQIKAACSDLEKIRKLKKEAEFLEASFRAKAASLQEGGGDSNSQVSSEEQKQNLKGKDTKNSISSVDQGTSRSRGFWGFFERPPRKKPAPKVDEYTERSRENVDSVDSESSEIYRFELLRNELIELEKRVQGSTDESVEEEGKTSGDPTPKSSSSMKGVELVQSSKKESVIEKTLDQIKETSTDVWQGTQLLAFDSAAAMELLRRSVIGDELTEKEKKALRRTITDLASVVPIGVLMLLPVTAVGHAAMLAAIQRYVPGLIPSTYGPERLNLLRQLEKVKQMKNETEPEEGIDEAES